MQLDLKTAGVRVDAAKLAAVLPFAGDRDVRFYLNGVRVMPAAQGGVLIIATDGRSLYCVRDREGKADRAVTLPLNQRKHARHLKPDHSLYVGDDDSIWVVDRDGITVWISPAPLVGGKYPDLARLVGNLADWQEGFSGAFQYDLLARAMDAGHRSYLRFFRRDENSAVLFTTGKDSFGLLMPYRDDNPSLAQVVPPEFMPQPEGGARND